MESDDQEMVCAFHEFQDMEPLYIDDAHVVSVQYRAEHREALAYFRAVLAKDEKSERAMRLTADMISFNQADYTAWQYRWDCLEALSSDLQQELQFTYDIMQDNAKNYQLWNHRRKCALKLGAQAAQRELEFAATALDMDEKNYHAWAHRQAVVEAFRLWAEELDYVDAMITLDVRNNSAWNQRFFVLLHAPHVVLPNKSASHRTASNQQGSNGSGTSGTSTSSSISQAQAAVPGAAGGAVSQDPGYLQQLLQHELEYVAGKIQVAPRNESTWNYLRGLFSLPGCRSYEMGRQPGMYTICVEALADCPSCAPALDALADFYHQKLCAIVADHPRQLLQSPQVLASVQQAVTNSLELLQQLMVADPMRGMYWQHRRQELQMLYKAVTAAPAISTM